jgi:3-hydroxyisobutyrate dehydrogenase-like beta-hydroxyacid dehydrogenase
LKLANDAAVKETFEKICELDIAGKTFCESSTIHPDITKELEKQITAKKAGFVAGPYPP